MSGKIVLVVNAQSIDGILVWLTDSSKSTTCLYVHFMFEFVIRFIILSKEDDILSYLYHYIFKLHILMIESNRKCSIFKSDRKKTYFLVLEEGKEIQK